ncbi:Carbon catabolite repressor protein 4 3, partial [Globisporangium splendens]
MADEQEAKATDPDRSSGSVRGAGAGRGRGRGRRGGHSHFPSEKRQRSQYHAQRQTKAFPRKWMMYAPPLHAETRVPLATSTFRVASLNTLADYLVVKDDALTSPQGWMYEWSYRGSRLIREIVAWSPHIVCLQEVDHYEDFFEPEMRKHGFVGIYKRRTGEETHDGCAIFVKRDMFTIVSSRPLEYHVADHPVLDRDNVALAAVLEWKDGASNSSSPQQFIVATTHVLFNPKRGDVKLAQLEMLTRMLSEWRSEQSSTLPVILCGDFNLEPHSALYHFLSTGSLDVSNLSRAALSGQNGYDDRAFQHAKFINENDASRHHGNGTAAGRFQQSKTRGRRGKHSDFVAGTVVAHDLELASAYAQSPDDHCTGEPKFTIFHSGSKGAVDYMWYTKDAVHCHGVLEMTPAGILFAQKALPTPHQSSDHLSLVADFSLRAMHAG